MTLEEFKNEVCSDDPRNQLLPTIGIIHYTPIEVNEGDEPYYEMGIKDLITIIKPNIHINYKTDLYQSIEFFEVQLKFVSSYDPDIEAIYNFLKGYEKEVSDNWNDVTKCPACSVFITPNKKYMEENIHFLELQMPLLVSLSSSKPNQMPNIISMLFVVGKCYLHESDEDLVDMKSINDDIAHERLENERLKAEEEARTQEEQARDEYMRKLQEEFEDTDDTPNHVIRIGRGAADATEHESDQE